MISPGTLREEMADIKFSPGDIIIEASTGNVGFLIKRDRRIDMELDDMYFWEVRWSDGPLISKFKTFSQFRILEENYLKVSIILDIIIWQSVV